jgi:transposase
MKFKRIAIDTSKHVFTLHGVDEQEQSVLRRELKRGQVQDFFSKLPGTGVVLETCGGSHHWARVLAALGHHVRLIPPQYVKPFVKRSKNDRKIEALDRQLLDQHKVNPVSHLLAAIPGVGPITAITMALTVDPGHFESGRHLAAWLGLTPREHSTAGKHRLGKISKAGNERLRQLLVLGAMAVIRVAKPGSQSASGWLLQLLERKPRKLAAVALANKMARIIWAMMARGVRGAQVLMIPAARCERARSNRCAERKYLARWPVRRGDVAL